MLQVSCVSACWKHLPSLLFTLRKVSLACSLSSALKDGRKERAAVTSSRKTKVKPTKSELPKMHRVIVLVDMDCFYVQVEERLAPEYRGRPCAVAQYNNFKGGGLIAVNYEARAAGVKRGMRGDQASKLCKDLHLFRVPEVRGKADLTRYRNAGEEVLKVMSNFSKIVERASIDEAYLDLTDALKEDVGTVTPDDLPNTHVVGSGGEGSVDERAKGVSDWLSSIEAGSPDDLLARAAKLVEQIRAAIFENTGFRCSAGVAHNKVLAKLACGLHKPNQQTVLPRGAVPGLFATLPVHKLRKLGGKFGEEIKERLQVETIGEVARFSEESLISTFGEKMGTWLYQLSRGIDDEPVTLRKVAKSIGCGKNFNGKLALNSKEKVKYWVQQLSEELSERLQHDREQNRRTAQLLVVGLRHPELQSGTGISRSCPLTTYDAAKIAHDAFTVLAKLNTAASTGNAWTPPLINLSLAASKFRDSVDEGAQDISMFLSASTSVCEDEKRKKQRERDKATSQPALPASEDDSSRSRDTSQIPELNVASVSRVGNPVTVEEGGTSEKSLSFAEKLSKLLSENDKSLKTNGAVKANPLVSSFGKTPARPRDSSGKFLVDPKTVDASVLPFLPANIQDEIQRSMKRPSCAEKKLTGLKKYFGSSPVKRQASEKKTRVQTGTALESEDDSNGSGGFVLEPGAGSKAQQDQTEFGTNRLPGGAVGDLRSESTTGGQHKVQQSDHGLQNDRVDERPPEDMQASEDMSNLDPELLHHCLRCGKEIPVWEKQEHDDFHLASDLSRGLPAPQQPQMKRKKNAKRGRPSKKKAENARTLEDFFN